MNTKIIISTVLIISLGGCQAVKVKTNEEIKAETRAKMIPHMRNSGISQESIDSTLKYIDLPYRKKIENKISDSRTATENLLELMEFSQNSCEFDRSLLNLPQASPYAAVETKNKIRKCGFDSLSVVRNYHNGIYSRETDNQNNKDIVSEVYIAWQAYMDGVSGDTSPYLIDDLSIKFKSEFRRANYKLTN